MGRLRTGGRRTWRADETYIKVNGGWVYLYRAVDERGRTVASYLSRNRDTGCSHLLSESIETPWATT
jgi:transposase-like protein